MVLPFKCCAVGERGADLPGAFQIIDKINKGAPGVYWIHKPGSGVVFDSAAGRGWVRFPKGGADLLLIGHHGLISG